LRGNWFVEGSLGPRFEEGREKGSNRAVAENTQGQGSDPHGTKRLQPVLGVQQLGRERREEAGTKPRVLAKEKNCGQVKLKDVGEESCTPIRDRGRVPSLGISLRTKALKLEALYWLPAIIKTRIDSSQQTGRRERKFGKIGDASGHSTVPKSTTSLEVQNVKTLGRIHATIEMVFPEMRSHRV